MQDITKRNVRKLGTVKSHTSDTRDLWIINGPVVRRPSKSHLKAKCSNDFKQFWDGSTLEFKKREWRKVWIPGINALTVAKMGVVFPQLDILFKSIEASLIDVYKENSKRVADACIWNLIFTRKGLKWIDLYHKFPSCKKDDIYIDFLKGS